VKTSDMLVLGVVGIALYYVWKTSQAVSGGISSGVNAVSGAVANLWNQLTAQPSMVLTGNVIFSNGSSIPLDNLQIATDAAGNVYVQYNGGVYQLGQSDGNGNWPATQVG
jgi:hypothetical protein